MVVVVVMVIQVVVVLVVVLVVIVLIVVVNLLITKSLQNIQPSSTRQWIQINRVLTALEMHCMTWVIKILLKCPVTYSCHLPTVTSPYSPITPICRKRFQGFNNKKLNYLHIIVCFSAPHSESKFYIVYTYRI